MTMSASSSIYDLWESENSCLCPLSSRQLDLIEKLENINSNQTLIEFKNENQIEEDDYNLINLKDWYKSLEDSVVSKEEKRYNKLVENLEQIKCLAALIDDILDNLEYLKKLYEFGTNKTDSLHNVSENILHQQHGLIMAVEAINGKLAYFKELEPLSIKLASCSSMEDLSESLMTTLVRLDECINFLKSKPNYKESAHYLAQFKELQSQALLTIKNHAISTLQTIAKQVMPESGEILTPQDSVFILFYGKFQASSHRFRSLMVLIEERCEGEEVYQQYLRECHQAFFSAREMLIVPVLTVAINEMVASHKRSYCSLTRNICRMLMHICKDEYQLYFQFFTKSSPLLDDFLEKLCTKLYNVLRPIVIHINQFEVLAELCTIIKYETIEEYFTVDNQELATFGRIMSQLLQDVQERLVYRTNIYIQSSIIGYIPASGDLAYPQKLQMMESIAECLKNDQAGISRCASSSSLASTSISDISIGNSERNLDIGLVKCSKSPADIYGMWYPTVRRTIMCLTKLYRSMDNVTFQGLAQEAVAGCLESLDSASQTITKNQTSTDGFLFLLKHLLIVREQITPFRIECTFREVAIDFNRVKSAAIDLIQKRENIFSLTSNNSLLKFLFEVPVCINFLSTLI